MGGSPWGGRGGTHSRSAGDSSRSAPRAAGSTWRRRDTRSCCRDTAPGAALRGVGSPRGVTAWGGVGWAVGRDGAWGCGGVGVWGRDGIWGHGDAAQSVAGCGIVGIWGRATASTGKWGRGDRCVPYQCHHMGTWGPGDTATFHVQCQGTGTGGCGDMGTRGHGDTGTQGNGDTGTRGHGDMGTWGHAMVSAGT